MTSKERTFHFIQNQKVDRPPFHPIIMRFAAKYAGVKYKNFCLDYKSKCFAMIKCADDFNLDWVTVMSDPYAESEGFDMQFTYPEDDLPKPIGPLITNISQIDNLTVPDLNNSKRMLNRIHEIEEFVSKVGEKYFIVGWVEGPMAEYTNLRGLSEACMDLYTNQDKVVLATEIIMENAIQFISAQIKAGAHCIGIGDAACSQIGPDLYKQFFFEQEKELVNHIHSLGALAKIHICGNTTSILPDIIKTGADIIDVDHLVTPMDPFTSLLSTEQVLCGNSDPVSVIQDGSRETIFHSVRDCFQQTGKRGIVSAGCEITPNTSVDNFTIYRDAASSLAMDAI